MAKKATFAAASFANLRAAAGEGEGEPLRIALVDIDEDPNQPRRHFDAAELEGMALTIRERGVLQPVSVRPPQDGRYTLVFGARRLRAAKLAGQADIPAIIVPEGQRDFAAQVIENQQRANLSNSELAAAVNQLHAEGKQGKEIAAICNLRDYQVAAYRAVEKLPEFLRQRLDSADVRAIYDVYRAWQKHPGPVEAAMPDEDTSLTITEARRIIAAVTGKATGSVVLDRAPTADAPPADLHGANPEVPQAAEPAGQDGAATALPVVGVHHAPERDEGSTSGHEGGQEPRDTPVPDASPAPASPRPRTAAPASAPAPRPAASPQPARAARVPVFVMETEDGRHGVLVTTERPEAEGHIFLDVEQAGRIEVAFAGLRCVSVQ